MVRWGIVCAAKFAHKFVKAEAVVENSRIAAVAARDAGKAEAFAGLHGIPKAYGGYERLFADPEVNAVYIASVHSVHKELILRGLAAGKHVFCEKPLCMNAGEVRECMTAAREKGLFLMEAMALPFLPAHRKIRKWVADGRIGEVRLVRADFSFNDPGPPEGRLLAPALGGGALLDIGVYTLHFACGILGYSPTEITGVTRFSPETGVDTGGTYSLLYPGGAVAALTCGIDYLGPYDGAVFGTEGKIFVSDFSWPGHLELRSKTALLEAWDFSQGEESYQHEINEAVSCILAGKPESDIMPLWKSLKAAEIIDKLLKV